MILPWAFSSHPNIEMKLEPLKHALVTVLVSELLREEELLTDLICASRTNDTIRVLAISALLAAMRSEQEAKGLELERGLAAT